MKRWAVANYAALMMPLVLLICGGLLVSAAAAAGSGRKEGHRVPAVFVFGDSTVDVGNNQYLPGNSPLQLPYGIDFPDSRPTGRFSNGYNIADCIAQLLGFKRSPPAYLSLTSLTSPGGVNYASGGSGILDTTGNTITLSKQVEYFSATKAKMLEKNSSAVVDELLSKSLFLISDGGNDMFAFLSQNRTASQVLSFYADLLSSYTGHVKALYNLGARRFGIIDVPPLGCLPGARATISEGGGATRCVDILNNFTLGFNDLLRAQMADLKLKGPLPGMRYSVGSSYKLVSHFTAHPEAAGFSNVSSACCGGGWLGAETGCVPDATYCENRNEYLFWDAVHGTQASSKKGAAVIYYAPLERGFAAPINFKQLVSS